MRTAPAADRALIRFLLARPPEVRILNDGGRDTGCANGSAKESAISADLLRAVRASSDPPADPRVRALAASLRTMDPGAATGEADRLAFWLNLYNALVIDAIGSFAVRTTVRDVPAFFRAAAYRVGAHPFTLEDIEHGVLRGNRPWHPRLPPPFGAGDPRASLSLRRLDPRIHFALNCGAASCPPIAVYDEGLIDLQLDRAGEHFVNGEGVVMEGGEAAVSALFSLYEADFGGPAGVRSWLARYLRPGPTRQALNSGRFRYSEYDWSLAGAPRESAG